MTNNKILSNLQELAVSNGLCLLNLAVHGTIIDASDTFLLPGVILKLK